MSTPDDAEKRLKVEVLSLGSGGMTLENISALQVLSAIRASGATLAELCADLRMFPQKLVNVRIAKGFDWKGSATLARAREEKRIADSG